MLPMVILAGGLATRLGGLTQKTPKALLPVAGEPFIFHQLRLLKRHGFSEVVICGGFLGDQIQAAVGDGGHFGLTVGYSFDWPDLLGTGGAVKKALPLLNDGPFMLMYGDSYLLVDYQEIAKIFLESGQPALMTVYQNQDLYDTSNVIFHDGVIKFYDKKNKMPAMNYIDYGLGCFCPDILRQWPDTKFDLAEVYTALSLDGQLVGCEVFTRFYEIGSHQGLLELDRFLKWKSD